MTYTASCDTNGDATVDDESTESRSDSDPGAIDIASVLSAFLNAEVLTELNGMENGDKLNRKRSAAIALDDSGMFGKKKNQWEENPNLEINDDFHCGGFDPLMLFENAEEIASASGLVDSKAKNKVTCVVCKIDVCNTARQRHVFMVHVKRDDMYHTCFIIAFYLFLFLLTTFYLLRCVLLSKSITFTLFFLDFDNNHKFKVHPDNPDAQPISNLEKYADEIRELQSRCFPNRPMKLVRPKESTRPRERHHCKKCGTQVAQSDRQRHVYHRHLQRTRIFECPLCNFASNYDVHRFVFTYYSFSDFTYNNLFFNNLLYVLSVKWHIKWMHKDDKDLEPISHENEFRLVTHKKSYFNYLVLLYAITYNLPYLNVHNVANVDPISNLELNPEHVQERFQKCFPSRKMKPGTFDKKKESAMMNDETKVTCQECFQEMKTEDRQTFIFYINIYLYISYQICILYIFL
uniref:C2H2-type domain-containing protein n=1 Tax=Heterorhabditis bacteriophora TaxID=37862 RepID=A0A1I7WQX0_HETBA